jgi:hypothetical protein
MEPSDQLLSVLVHREWVFASTPKGVYRASPHDKKWVAIRAPDHVPCVGWLAKQEPAASFIYYTAPSTGAFMMSSTAGKTFGLYRFDPRGEHWELVSSKHSFAQLYVPDDWSIYGVDETLPDANPWQSVVRMSADSGKHWQDISGNMRSGFQPWSIFPDPDHEGLICVRGGGGYGEAVAQADDKRYRWHFEATRYWNDAHCPTADLFDRALYEGGHEGTGILIATLGNYFDAPFEGETQISAFDVEVASRYTFRQSDPVVVPVNVIFRQRPGISATLMDTERGHLVWSLRRVLPNGTREIIGVACEQRAEGTLQETFSDGTRRLWSPGIAARTGPDNLRSHRLTNGMSYKRSLNLSEMCGFSKPGAYRVQLEYAAGHIADPDKDEWVEGFTSRVFVVNVVGSF